MKRLPRGLLPAAGGTSLLVWLVALAAFLAVLGAAAALAIGHGTAALARGAADRLTVEIAEADGDLRTLRTRQVLAILRHTPEIQTVHRVDDREVARLMGQWVGDAAAADLPPPVLIDLALAPGARAVAVRRALAHVRFAEVRADADTLQPYAALLGAARRLAIGLGIVSLAATLLVTVLIARASLATHRRTVATLHALGATDRQVARLLQRRVAREALAGAAIGFAVAAGVILFIAAKLAMLEGAPMAQADPGWAGWLGLATVPLALTILAVAATRMAVLAELARAP